MNGVIDGIPLIGHTKGMQNIQFFVILLKNAFRGCSDTFGIFL